MIQTGIKKSVICLNCILQMTLPWGKTYLQTFLERSVFLLSQRLTSAYDNFNSHLFNLCLLTYPQPSNTSLHIMTQI